MTAKAIHVRLTESEMEACWSAVSYLDDGAIGEKISRALDHACLTRLYNVGHDASDGEVTGYGLPQYAIELTREELYRLIEGLERAVGRYELGSTRPVPVEEAHVPVQRYHEVHRKLYRVVSPTA